MKIERGETYITFDESDGVEPEHLGRWKLTEGTDEDGCSAESCGLHPDGVEGCTARNHACDLVGGDCLSVRLGRFVRA